MVNTRRRIGFPTSYDDLEPEPLKEIDTTEKKEESSPALLSDYIPGAVYDGQGNIVTEKSFNAKVKKLKAEARNLNWSALARLILYTSLGASILLLSHGVYKKYFDVKNSMNRAKTEIVRSKER